MDNRYFSCCFSSIVNPRLSRKFFISTLLKDFVEISTPFAKWLATAMRYIGGYFFPSSDTRSYFMLVLCSGTPFVSINFRASMISCFFSFGIAMRRLLCNEQIQCFAEIALFPIDYPKRIALERNFSTCASRFRNDLKYRSCQTSQRRSPFIFQRLERLKEEGRAPKRTAFFNFKN